MRELHVTESRCIVAFKGNATLTAHPEETVVDGLAGCHTPTFEFVKRNKSCL